LSFSDKLLDSEIFLSNYLVFPCETQGEFDITKQSLRVLFCVPQQSSDAQFSAFSSCAFSAYMCCNCPLGTRNMNLNSSAIDELGKWCLKEVGGAMSQASQMQRLSMTTLRMATTVTDRTDTYLILTMQRGREQATSKLSKNYPVMKQIQNYLTSEAGPYNMHRLLHPTPGHTAQEATAGQHNFAFYFV